MTTALKLTVTNQSNYYKRYNSTVNTFAYAVQTHAAFKYCAYVPQYEVTAKRRVFFNYKLNKCLNVTVNAVFLFVC